MQKPALGYSLVTANDMDETGMLNLAIAIVEAAKQDYCDVYYTARSTDNPVTILKWTQSPLGQSVCLGMSQKDLKADWDRMKAHVAWRKRLLCNKCTFGENKNCKHRGTYKKYNEQKCKKGEEVRLMEIELGKWLDLQAEAAHKWSYNGSMGVNADEIGVKVYGLDKMAEAVMKKIHTETMENGETVRFIKWKRVRFYEPIEGEKDA